ncbi:hypothetical protein HDU76_011435 [Blyttiomyces sp. JEL0837]|nr:hypothetical protein HDU76_011435 [Blyttiomyces sp. JEL0837]
MSLHRVEIEKVRELKSAICSLGLKGIEVINSPYGLKDLLFADKEAQLGGVIKSIMPAMTSAVSVRLKTQQSQPLQPLDADDSVPAKSPPTGIYRQYQRNEFRTSHVNRQANTSRPPSIHVDQFKRESSQMEVSSINSTESFLETPVTPNSNMNMNMNWQIQQEGGELMTFFGAPPTPPPIVWPLLPSGFFLDMDYEQMAMPTYSQFDFVNSPMQ